MTRVLDTIADIRAAVAAERLAGRTVALTPTMGALHEGHLTHVRHAASVADTRVVSIFVNPTQFGPNEDLDAYPRTFDADLAALEAEGVDLVFAPSVAEMYPTGPTATVVTAGEVGTRFEGASRPGHFDGMLTVVAKLLSIVRPDVATFGQKDAQQLFLVRRMAADLDLGARIEAVPTVREADGLALSSRNRYLSAEQRTEALALWRTLEAVASAASQGPDVALGAGREVLAAHPAVVADYLALVDPVDFAPVAADYRGEVTALIAARVGTTRLIDNLPLTLG